MQSNKKLQIHFINCTEAYQFHQRNLLLYFEHFFLLTYVFFPAAQFPKKGKEEREKLKTL